MRLIYSSQEYEIEGIPLIGFPILLYDSLHTCEPVNLFLRYYLLRGAIGSKRSWSPIGQSLYDYFSFLQAAKRNWNELRPADKLGSVVAYKMYCERNRRLRRNTIVLRLTYICVFYEYALKWRWITELPFDYEDLKPQKTKLNRSTKATRSVIPKQQKSIPAYLTAEQVELLIASTCNPHHRMMIEFALGTGLRREEIATSPARYVFSPAAKGVSTRLITLRIDPADGSGMATKGSKPREIVITRRLMQSLYQYLIQVRGLRSNLSPDEKAPLFVNQMGQPFSNYGKGIEKIIRTIGKRCGIKVYPHMLRHTYATNMAYEHRSKPDFNVLNFLKNQLGHGHVETTMKYTHSLDELVERAIVGYDAALCGTPTQ